MPDTALVFFDRARQALEQASSLDEVRDIRDRKASAWSGMTFTLARDDAGSSA
jgi:hypothetical protein